MSESTLRRILAFAKKQPENPIADRKPGSGRPTKITPAIEMIMKRKLVKTPTLTAKQLKKKILELANVSVRQIRACVLEEVEAPLQEDVSEAPSHRENEEAEAGLCQGVRKLGGGGLEEGHVQ